MTPSSPAGFSSTSSPLTPNSPKVASPTVYPEKQRHSYPSTSTESHQLKKRRKNQRNSDDGDGNLVSDTRSRGQHGNSSTTPDPTNQCLLISILLLIIFTIVSLFLLFIYHLIKSHLYHKETLLPPIARGHHLLGSVRMVRPELVRDYPVALLGEYQTPTAAGNSLLGDKETEVPESQEQQEQGENGVLQQRNSLARVTFDLVIGINTLRRTEWNSNKHQQQELSYLKETVNSLHLELEKLQQDELYRDKRILILVHDLPPSKKQQQSVSGDSSYSSTFHELRTKYKENSNFIFYQVTERFWDPFQDNEMVQSLEDEEEEYHSSAQYDTPHARRNRLARAAERQHNCDVASLGTIALHHLHFKYFMFLEDDYKACPGALLETLKILDELEERYDEDSSVITAHKSSKICALRVSYGFSGLVFPRKELIRFLYYVESNIDLHTIDQLAHNFLHSKRVDPHVSFCAGRNPPQVTFTGQRVQFEHIGVHSAYDERKPRNNDKSETTVPIRYPKCGDMMQGGSFLLREEEFDSMKCRGEKVSPCWEM